MAPSSKGPARKGLWTLPHLDSMRTGWRKPSTMVSTHGLSTYPNHARNHIPIAENQLWISDITYIQIMNDDSHGHFCYLSMMPDAYKDGIVGWSVGLTLDTECPMAALRMSLKRIEGKDVNLIHHSDRDCLYDSRIYVNMFIKRGIQVSMTESGDPKDNVQAERINNTMKNEQLKDKIFMSVKETIASVTFAVDFYNNRRPHMSIGMMTSAEAAESIVDRDMRWISYKQLAI